MLDIEANSPVKTQIIEANSPAKSQIEKNTWQSPAMGILALQLRWLVILSNSSIKPKLRRIHGNGVQMALLPCNQALHPPSKCMPNREEYMAMSCNGHSYHVNEKK